jgi:aspartate-semialdehyde dehydrogenase
VPAQFLRQQRHDALAGLRDRRLLRELAYVGGKWTSGSAGHGREVTDPATGLALAWVAGLEEDDVTHAIDVASSAFEGWRRLLPQQRATVLRAWFNAIVAASDDLALLMSLEQGKPLSEAAAEIEYAASFVEWYAEEAKRLNAESVTSHLANAQMVVRREAVGVVGIVTPWNFPSAMLTRKVAAALAAGCTTVAHPSSYTPLSALALAELGDRAGLPPGVFNVVTGEAQTVVGRICDDTRVRALSFTGSTAIGRRLAARAAATMKRLVMELGGHAPLIVFADSDLERAVEIALAAKFTTSGQDCLAVNRLYVERPIYDAFCVAFAERTAALKVGHGLLPDVAIGPLMHERAVSKVEEHVRDAVERGARCLVGGGRHSAGPLFFEPTVLVDVSDDALIMHEETFGPVAPIMPFDSESEVIARANATEDGLIAYVITRDAARAIRLAAALDYGMIAVNRAKITGAPIPFGGMKQSGLGREGSRHGIEAFTDLKYVCLDAA